MRQFKVKGHNWLSLAYCAFNSLVHKESLGMCNHEITQIMQFVKLNYTFFRELEIWEVIMFQAIFGFYFDITISYFLIFFLRSVNYSNVFYELFVTFWKCQDTHSDCLFWNVFSIDIYGKIIFNCLLLFYYITCLSENCMS